MLPKVSIQFCAQCKWHNRAVWYVQEILQTFSDPAKNLVAEVSVCPLYDQPGMFQVLVSNDKETDRVVYRRRMRKAETLQTEAFYYDGFPDSKLLKILLRNALFPETALGHADGTGVVLADCVACNENE